MSGVKSTIKQLFDKRTIPDEDLNEDIATVRHKLNLTEVPIDDISQIEEVIKEDIHHLQFKNQVSTKLPFDKSNCIFNKHKDSSDKFEKEHSKKLEHSTRRTLCKVAKFFYRFEPRLWYEHEMDILALVNLTCHNECEI